MRRSFIFSLRLFLFFFINDTLILSAPARGDIPAGRWMPKSRQLAAQNTSKECSVYRALLERAQREGDASRTAVQDVSLRLQERRGQLEACGLQRGLKRAVVENDETRLAEVCPDEYEHWVAPGYRLQMYQQDAATAKQTVQILQAEIHFQCGGALPPGVQTVLASPPPVELLPTDSGDTSPAR